MNAMMGQCLSGGFVSASQSNGSSSIRYSWGSGSNSLEFIVPPINAITSFVGSSATITSSLSNDLDAGAKAAQGKDVCLVFANA
jgi:beta-glucosidase